MILNEKVEDFFTNKELEKLDKMKSSQDSYNNLSDDIVNPYNPNYSDVIEFTIEGEDVHGECSAKMGCIIDHTNSQIIIKQLKIKEELLHNTKNLVSNLLTSLITNMEEKHPEISVVFWRVNKNNKDCIYSALNKGFTVQDSNSYAMELTYYLMSSPVRQSNNSLQLLKAHKNHVEASGTFNG